MRALYILLLMSRVGPKQVFFGALLLFLAFKVFVTVTYVPDRWDKSCGGGCCISTEAPAATLGCRF